MNERDYNRRPCIQLCQIDVVTLLLRHGADISATDDYRSTPLLFSIKEDKLEIVKLLLNAGANVTLNNCYNFSPFQVASKAIYQCFGKAEIAKLLLEYNAVMDGDHVDVMKEMIKKGASVNVTTEQGTNRLVSKAIEHFNEENIHQYIDYFFLSSLSLFSLFSPLHSLHSPPSLPLSSLTLLSLFSYSSLALPLFSLFSHSSFSSLSLLSL